VVIECASALVDWPVELPSWIAEAALDTLAAEPSGLRAGDVVGRP
jgi:hypothetical protein